MFNVDKGSYTCGVKLRYSEKAKKIKEWKTGQICVAFSEYLNLKRFNWIKCSCGLVFFERSIIQTRDVTTGAVAPKFSDTLTLSQPRRDRFCSPSQRSQLSFSRGYVPANLLENT
jgi:hypothetical protein